MRLLVFLTVFIAAAMQIRGQGAGNVQVVRNVSDLALRPPSTLNPGVSVLGYTTNGDWGEPRTMVYVPDSVATVDNGCVFAALGGVGRWVSSDCEGAHLDPRWFGAIVGDLLDDSAALQATIDAAGAATSVLLPRGVYSITNTLYITNNAVTIRGDGPDSSTIWMRSNGPAMYVGFPGFDGGFNDYSRHQFVLEDFGVRGVDGVTNQVGIQVSAASRVALNRVFAETFGDEHEKGFFFDRWSWWISVQNCKTYNCWIGLLASGNTTNVNIPENSFNAADFSGNTFRSGRYGMILGDPLYSPDTPLLPTAYAVGIRNSSFENFGELGVWIASPWNCIVDNNYIENNPIGVRIGATNWTSRVYDQAKNVAIKNNHIYTLTNSASAGLVLQNEKTCVQIQGGLFATIKENHFMGYKRAAVEIQSTGVKQTAVDGNGYYNYAEVPRVIGPFTNGVAGNSFFHRWLGESWIGSGTNGPDELINNIVIDGSTNLFRAQVVLTNKPLQFAHGASDWKLSKFLDENRGLFHGGFSVSNGGINLLSTNGAGYALAYKRDYDPVQRTVIPQDGTLRFSDGTFDPDVGIGYAGAAGWIRLWTNIQGYGHVSVGPNPSIWSGYAKYGDRGIYHTSTDTSARPEVLIGYQDGTTNQRVGIAVSNRIGIVSALASLGGSEIRFMVDDQHAATVTNAGVVIPSGKSINMAGDTIDDLTGTGLSVVGGKLTATGGGTNASTVFVDGTQVDAPNFVVSTEVDPSVAIGTNVSLALRDGSIGTNRVDANFHALLVAGGGGDIYSTSNNVFSGTNQFLGPTSFDTLNVGTLNVTNPFPASGITNPIASRFAVFGSDNRLTNDVAETGTGAPVRAVSPALTGSPTVPTAAAGTSNSVAASTKYVDDAVAAAPSGGGATNSYSFYEHVDELLNQSTWTLTANSGTAANSGIALVTLGYPGQMYLLGNAQGEYPTLTSVGGVTLPYDGQYAYELEFFLKPTLTPAADTNRLDIGWRNSWANTNLPSSGALLSYSTNQWGPNWQLVCTTNSVPTVINTGVAVSNAWTKAAVRMTPSNVVALFNGTPVATNSFAPTNVVIFMGVGQQRHSGTTDIYTHLDRARWSWSGPSR